MSAPVLSLEHISKRFGALVVSDDVTLDVLPGEVHAIIGPNGAGKTTIIHQIAGSLAPDSGTIHLHGRDVTRLKAHERARLGLARSFQITNVLKGFSALENVALAAQARDGSSFRFFGDASRERALNGKAMAALETVSLGHRAQVPAGQLSHGEKRSLELAIALALEPKVLLLDEPMAGTGREETQALVDTLGALKGRFAMVLVEHDMSAVFALADRVSVLVGGAVVASGEPTAIRADPAVRAAYLGEQAAC